MSPWYVRETAGPSGVSGSAPHDASVAGKRIARRRIRNLLGRRVAISISSLDSTLDIDVDESRATRPETFPGRRYRGNAGGIAGAGRGVKRGNDRSVTA
ncbi:MAG: hypothetical protein RQ745_12105 [Longimicrobiales bacterium]|nr:hypothetical protein [Longimicrobiales bacterium]